MADYSIFVLPESQISFSVGGPLDGVNQGDGSHLPGDEFQLLSYAFLEVGILDNDQNFDDNDSNQRTENSITIDGLTLAANTRIEAEYRIVAEVVGSSPPETYEIIGVNFREPGAPNAFGTTEGLAFVGALPPVGVTLRVISATEGPGSLGQPSINVNNFVCFGCETRIATPKGPCPIEDLRIGDEVWTEDGEPITIRWIGQRHIPTASLTANPKLRPVRITAGALGGGLPQRDLLVSRQHRMLVRSRIAERMFGVPDVLVPAIKLTALPGIYVDETLEDITYLHLLFDHHEILLAEGAPSESLLTGPEALKAVGDDAREELELIFPELHQRSPKPVRLVPRGRQQKSLVERHRKNAVPLLFGSS